MASYPRLVGALLAALVVGGCTLGGARAQGTAQDPDEDDSPAAAAGIGEKPPAKLPAQDLTKQILFELLYGEIATQRGNEPLAAQMYLDLAKRTRDPRVARRAVEMAKAARQPQQALEAARIWSETDPESAYAQQEMAILLVGQKRVDDAEPYIAKLLGGNGAATPNMFMQLPRLLAINPDAQANLRVAQRLAARHDTLAQAHFAVAQSAAAANEDALALSEVRRAAALKPDWELAALYEAQLLQRRAPGEAVKRLAGFLEKNPDSRDVRLNYARMLVLDKRLPEAREQFERILERFKNDGDAIYAVGLLAYQVKEYGIAEENLKRLVDMGYRDANAARYTLGQIAEERKDWAAAVDWYKGIQRGEHAMPARVRTANAIAKQGRLDEARSYLRAVNVSGEPQRVQLLVAESQLLRDANQHRAAYDLLGEALTKTPDNADLLYDHALTAEKLDRFDVLESNLKRLIQLRPDHAHAYNALGYSFADRNIRLTEAKQLIEKALAISPEDFFIVDSMGWVLYRMGDLKGAAAQLRRAWDGRPDGEIGAHFGEVLWAMGEKDEARRIWGEAQKASPDNETLQKTLKRFNP